MFVVRLHIACTVNLSLLQPGLVRERRRFPKSHLEGQGMEGGGGDEGDGRWQADRGRWEGGQSAHCSKVIWVWWGFAGAKEGADSSWHLQQVGMGSGGRRHSLSVVCTYKHACGQSRPGFLDDESPGSCISMLPSLCMVVVVTVMVMACSCTQMSLLSACRQLGNALPWPTCSPTAGCSPPLHLPPHLLLHLPSHLRSTWCQPPPCSALLEPPC